MDTALNLKSASSPVLVIDARMAENINHGIAAYVSQLAQGLSQINSKKALPYRPVFLVQNSRQKDFHGFETHFVSAEFLNVKEWLEIPKALKFLGASAYHSPSFSSLIPGSCPCPYLITIHDLIHLNYGSLPNRIYYQTLLKPFARKANRLITVSEASKKILARWLNCKPEKISVAWNAIEEPSPIHSGDFKSLGLKSQNYFVCLSNSKPHKNLDLLLKAYSSYRSHCLEQQVQPWDLVLTLPKTETSIEGVRYIGKLPATGVQELLHESGGLLSPSLEEGFGLPPVEAAARGIRVAVSDIPPHREGLTDLAEGECIWVPASDLHAWTKAFSLLQSQSTRTPSLETRKKILERFNVRRLAEHMDRLYLSVLGLGPS